MRYVKTYEVRGCKNYHTGVVDKNGRVIAISFTGGLVPPSMTGARYTTADASIQEALEKSDKFKHVIHLVKETALDDSVLKDKDVTGGKLDEKDNAVLTGTSADSGNGTGTGINIEDVKNFTQAKEYLNKIHAIPHSQLKNAEQVKEAVSKLGISFPKFSLE